MEVLTVDTNQDWYWVLVGIKYQLSTLGCRYPQSIPIKIETKYLLVKCYSNQSFMCFLLCPIWLPLLSLFFIVIASIAYNHPKYGAGIQTKSCESSALTTLPWLHNYSNQSLVKTTSFKVYQVFAIPQTKKWKIFLISSYQVCHQEEERPPRGAAELHGNHVQDSIRSGSKCVDSEKEKYLFKYYFI